jgi:hypothetical protein
VSGLVLTLSAFTDWYAGTLPNGITLGVTGWHSGTLGKLVFFLGLATLILEASRSAGIELPAAVPDRLILIGLGALAVIFVLIRLISVPDTYFVSTSRGIGLYIALLGALGLLGAGLLRRRPALGLPKSEWRRRRIQGTRRAPSPRSGRTATSVCSGSDRCCPTSARRWGRSPIPCSCSR